MPLVRIDLARGKSKEFRTSIGDVVYEAMRHIINVPENDRFQIITEHPPEELSFDRTYMGIRRTDDCIFIQITMSVGRTIEQKKAFFKAIADGLYQRLQIRPEDVFINLVEVVKENWSFGNGEAQYAT